MLRNLPILALLAAIVGLPFALRPRDNLLGRADETLVIVTPHNEAIRAEFARGFREWYQAKTGKTARIDWRIPGGTSEIARYLASEYQAPFENLYKAKGVYRYPWSPTIQRSFDDPKIKLAADDSEDGEREWARRFFLNSEAGIGIDLFFGGGSFDFIQQGDAGRLVDSGFVKKHPELFNASAIPQTVSGEPFWDKDGRWFGTVLSSFGVCYNVDGLERLHLAAPPQNWADLARPVYRGEVALADPNKSASVAKAFEMIIQQQIGQSVGQNAGAAAAAPANAPAGAPAGPEAKALEDVRRVVGETDPKRLESDAIRGGWERAMRLIQKAGANTRYFTDSAPKIAIDVAQGDATLGMAIDFYGRFESENARQHSGRERMRYFSPPEGTSYGVDSIGLLRGAPHRELAESFLEYVMSLEGQKLWGWRVNTPGGPHQYALRRLPIRPELYAPEFAEFRSDPEVFPYEEAKKFIYHREWTGSLFNPIRFIVRVLCVDPHEEAREAWAALVEAKFPPEATHVFEDVDAVSYAEAKGRINEALRNSDKLVAERLTGDLTEHFRAQYRRAEALARAGK